MKFDLNKLQQKLLAISEWVNGNSVLQALKNAFIRIIPFTVIGSFSNLIKTELDNLINNQHITWFWLVEIDKLCGYIGTATLGMIGITVLFSSGYSYAKELHKDPKNKNMNIFIATLLSFAAYFVMVPNNVNFNNSKAKVIEGFATSFFSYEGMFTALLVGMFSVFLYAHFSRSKFAIKMPASVPQNIFDSFFALIPMLEVLLIFGVARLGLEALGFNSLVQMISQILMKPLLSVGTGLPAIIIVILAEQLLWFVGLHGFNIVWGIISGFWLPLFLEQVAKYAKTQSFKGIMIAPNTMTNVYAMIGGSGATFGLLLAILIFVRKNLWNVKLLN